MNPIIKKQRVASLILKERTIGLNPAEEQELNRWRRDTPGNEMIYDRLHEKDFSIDLSRYKQINTEEGFARYHDRYPHKRKKSLPRWHWVAAAAVLVIGFTSIFLFQETNKNIPYSDIEPGSSKAMLVLHNGNVINLTGKAPDKIVITEALSIRNDGAELHYSVSGKAQDNLSDKYNELIIPKGGEFTLTLSDGTKVWLNSQSKLKYPVAFNNMNREVYLEGEAYFEVTKDMLHPFRVSTKDKVTVEVLGTSFNVRSYADENKVETVLEEGSVRMSKGDDHVILIPGNKAVYLPNEAMRVTSVNTELYTAWRHGQYIFMNESVENILKQLSRWYNIEIFYSNEAAKSIIFSGDIKKYDNITTLLEAMEIAGGIHFKINGNTLIVSLAE